MKVGTVLQRCLSIAVGSRAMALAVGLLGMLYLGTPPGARLPPRSSDNVVFDLPARWDTGWYVGLASGGYKWDGRAGRFENIAFFPAYPLTLGAVASLSGAGQSQVRWNWTGVVLSTALFAGALWFLWRLGERMASPGVGSRAVLLCAAYPFAIFFGLPYTESMFLLACCAATYRYLSGRYAEAMLWGILAGLTRPNGSLLALLLGLLWLRQAYDLLRRDGPRDAWPARVFVSGVAACGPLFGMAIYSAYIYGMTGDPFLWATVQQGWGRGTANPIVVLGQLSMELVQSPLTTVAQRPFDLLNGLAGLVALGVVVPIGRRLGWPFAMFVLMGVLLPLTVGGLPSLGRYTAVLFPLFIYGAAISSGRTFTALLTIGVIAQGLVAALFFTWRPIY